MAFYDELTKSVQKSTEFLREHVQQLQLFPQVADDIFAKIKRDLEECRKTGKIPTFSEKPSTGEDLVVQVKNEALSPVKPSRKVLRDSQIINNNNKHQETNVSAKVKEEKLSNVLPLQRGSVNDMPPPQSLPLKKPIKTENTRSTRPRTRRQKQKENQSENGEVEERKDSDVIIQNTSIVAIDLCSDEEEPKEVRSTRTRTRNATKKTKTSTESAKRSRSADSNKSRTPSMKTSKKKKTVEREESVYEDALSDNVKNTETNVQGTSNIMTDDEDSPVASKTFVKGKNAKPLFSAFDHSPVKKKVEAFEKLEAIANAANNTPVRQTRTKTRTQAKEKNEIEEATTNKGAIPKFKTKLQTPLSSHLLNSTSKLSKPSGPSPVPKSLSAIKSSAAEFRERELKRQKEAEARQKREALLQAQMEEKRRKREEKQIKAQQMREEIENQKKKHLEIAEKMKEEKLKQQMAEREAKLQKQKEELEKKRQAAKQKAMGEKKKGQEEQPIYMIKKAPLLPTPDCYDSDSEEGQDQKFELPVWTKGKELSDNLKAMYAIGEQLKNSFFCRKAQTIDLEKVFPGIDRRKLKRTSSAMWSKPPRFTLMPQFINSLNVTEEADESSDNEP